MTTRRFEITPVNESKGEKITFHPSEIVPLINVETDVPSPPPLPSSFTTVNETNKPPIRLINSFIQRLKPNSSTTDLVHKNETSSLPGKHSNSMLNLNVNREVEEVDSCNSTLHTLDTNSFPANNKFLQELRSKRLELHEKGKHLPIDQRIALNRFQCNRDIVRAQDIFAVHFASEEDADNTSAQYDIFNENAQEQIRKNIFNELDRQRIKQLHKQYRHLILGRALLIFITSMILFMSITLIYVVIDLYDRANHLDLVLGYNEFAPINYDENIIP